MKRATAGAAALGTRISSDTPPVHGQRTRGETRLATGDARLSRLCFAPLAIAALWFATHPFLGIFADARFYLLEAMERVDPGRFRDDLYFRFGSQGGFSVYDTILSALVRVLGPVRANVVATAAGEVCWLAAATAFVTTVFRAPEERFAALICGLLFAPFFVGVAPLSYLEGTQSPRPFAEALVIAGLALVITKRRALALPVMATAFLVHPIMALPGACVAVLLSIDQWSWKIRVAALISAACLGGALLAGLAALGIEPFVRLGRVMDGHWWQVVRLRCGYAVLGQWAFTDFARLFFLAELALIVWWRSTAVERRLLAAATVATAAFFVVSFLGVDWLHNVAVTNAQGLRAAWIPTLLVNMLAGPMILRLRARSDPHLTLVAVALLVHAINQFCMVLDTVAIPPLTVAIALMLRDRYNHSQDLPSRVLVGLTVCVTIIPVCLVLFVLAQVQLKSPAGHLQFFNEAVCVAIVAAIWLEGRGQHAASIALAGTAMLVALLAMDQRPAWEIMLERRQKPPPAIEAILDQSRNIYWEHGLEFLWFDLHRQSYFSVEQGTGVMFYKNTALEYERRGRALSLLNTVDFSRPGETTVAMPARNPTHWGPTSRASLRLVCRDLPDLDLIVLATLVPQTSPAVWTIPVSQYLADPAKNALAIAAAPHYYFYRCADYRLN